jgi:formylglycine-generating enzyme required for sulfatase activity
MRPGTNPAVFKGPGDRPVENLGHKQALEFIRRLNKREGTEKYRLPTEAEWEYACRAQTRTAYSFGNSPGGLADHAWYAANSGHKTHPVGHKKPNPWGLHDMHGNVWEWCSDFYATDYYQKSPLKNPKGPASGQSRVTRGGACYNKPKHLRSAQRGECGPTDRPDSVGFRVVKDF